MVKKLFLCIAVIMCLWGGQMALDGQIKLFGASTAYAIGDLLINWGVPNGNPIFSVANFKPGDTETHSVSVQNNALQPRNVAVMGIKTNEAGEASLAGALLIKISDGTTDIYGGTTGAKTLAQFFTDSQNPNGVGLSNIPTGETKNYTFSVTFEPAAGNIYQNANVVFDLKIGINTEIPQECNEWTNRGIVPIFGTDKNDRIFGTRGDDIIFALEGNDKVFGNGGKDCIVGGTGVDRLYGEQGDDQILGGEGNDRIFGGSGRDTITGDGGADQLWGEGGADFITGGIGDDKIRGGNEGDTLFGNAGSDTIWGGTGSDEIHGNEENDILNGGAGNDTILGEDGLDRANGSTGSDACNAEIETSCEL